MISWIEQWYHSYDIIAMILTMMFSHGGTYRFSRTYWFHAGTYWYVWVHTSRLTCWILRLKFRPAESADFTDSAGRYTNACTNRFIHSPPLPAALAPFAGLAEAGCSAAAGGSGAIAPSAAAGPVPAGRRPRIGPSAGCGRKRQSFVAKRRSMILGWVLLQAQGTLRTTL